MPLKNKQLVTGGKRGDCLRACITGLLCVPNPSGFPNPHGRRWLFVWRDWLDRYGLYLDYTQRCCIEGYWIASVPSLNFTGSTHAIIMHGQDVWHDPSTKKTYSAGKNLLGTNLVNGGHILVLQDFSKLVNMPGIFNLNEPPEDK